MIPRFNSNLSAYLQNLPTSLKDRAASLKDWPTPLHNLLKDPHFTRRRTKASMAVAVAAAAAGIGAVGVSAGTSTWPSATGNPATATSAARHNGNLFGSTVDADDVDTAAHSQPANTAAKQTATPAPKNTQAKQPAVAPAQPAKAAVKAAKAAKAAPAKAPATAHPAAPAKKAGIALNQQSSPTVGQMLQAFPLPLSGAQHQAGAKPAAAHGQAKPKAAGAKIAAIRPPAKAKPYTIYDAVNPGAIPSGQQQVAVYANGNYQASWSDARGHSSVLWIDTQGDNPGCNVLDVEPGDATPTQAAQWAHARLTQYPNHTAIIYTMRSEWPAVKSAVNGLPAQMRANVRYWIADPTNQKHMVAGADATQWYWGQNFDITMASPRFTS